MKQCLGYLAQLTPPRLASTSKGQHPSSIFPSCLGLFSRDAACYCDFGGRKVTIAGMVANGRLFANIDLTDGLIVRSGKGKIKRVRLT